MNNPLKIEQHLLVDNKEYQDKIKRIRLAEYLMFSRYLIKYTKELCIKVLEKEQQDQNLYKYKFVASSPPTTFFESFNIVIDHYVSNIIDITNTTISKQISKNHILELSILDANKRVEDKIKYLRSLATDVTRYYQIIYDNNDNLKTINLIIGSVDRRVQTINRLIQLQKDLLRIIDLPDQ